MNEDVLRGIRDIFLALHDDSMEECVGASLSNAACALDEIAVSLDRIADALDVIAGAKTNG